MKLTVRERSGLFLVRVKLANGDSVLFTVFRGVRPTLEAVCSELRRCEVDLRVIIVGRRTRGLQVREKMKIPSRDLITLLHLEKALCT